MPVPGLLGDPKIIVPHAGDLLHALRPEYPFRPGPHVESIPLRAQYKPISRNQQVKIGVIARDPVIFAGAATYDHQRQIRRQSRGLPARTGGTWTFLC